MSHTGSGRVADIIEIASLVGLYLKIWFSGPVSVPPPKIYALFPSHTAAVQDRVLGNLADMTVTEACTLGENIENVERHRRLTIIIVVIFFIFLSPFRQTNSFLPNSI
jgi:hypothetical protein